MLNHKKEMTKIIQTDFINYLIQHNAIVPYNYTEFTAEDKKNWIIQFYNKIYDKF